MYWKKMLLPYLWLFEVKTLIFDLHHEPKYVTWFFFGQLFHQSPQSSKSLFDFLMIPLIFSNLRPPLAGSYSRRLIATNHNSCLWLSNQIGSEEFHVGLIIDVSGKNLCWKISNIKFIIQNWKWGFNLLIVCAKIVVELNLNTRLEENTFSETISIM